MPELRSTKARNEGRRTGTERFRPGFIPGEHLLEELKLRFSCRELPAAWTEDDRILFEPINSTCMSSTL